MNKRYQPGSIFMGIDPFKESIISEKMYLNNYSKSRSFSHNVKCKYCGSENDKYIFVHCKSCSAPLPGIDWYQYCKSAVNKNNNLRPSDALRIHAAPICVAEYRPWLIPRLTI